ncbi:MAG: tRNA pseudouridine(55) synthase TruB [Bacteroidales bacterium]
MEEKRLNYFEEGRILIFDKPAHWTSFDLVNKIRIMIRAAFGLRKIKVGHAGTLDPLATGLMIICTGPSTRRIEEFMGFEKEYTATIELGATTPSFDLETEIDDHFPVNHITEEMVTEMLKKFTGEQLQVPPLFSAKFIDGKRAYKFARKGQDIEMEPVKVNIREIELLSFSQSRIRIRMVCGKGTYIRAFARDLGKSLNSGAYISELRRTATGPYRIEEAMDLEKFRLFLEHLKQT